MGYAQTMARLRQRRILHSVMIELTYGCNLDCVYCYNNPGVEREPLDLDRYLSLLDELAEMQVMHLVLTGGEPIVHPDFFAIGGHARELGFAVRIKSNGYVLDQARAARLKAEVDPFLVDVSLHGAEAATHDRQTRVPGSFERTLANLRGLVGVGLRVRLSSTLTRYNETEVEALYALADSLGVSLTISPTVTPRDGGDQGPLALAPSREGIERLLRARRERSRGEGHAGPPSFEERVCNAGASTLTIAPGGRVFPCVQWRRPVGDVRTESIREIWHGSEGLAEVRELAVAARRSAEASTPELATLAFCPGLAEQCSGSPCRLYPSLERELAARRAREGEDRF